MKLLALPAVTESTKKHFIWYQMTPAQNDTLAIIRGQERCKVHGGPVKVCRKK